MSEPTVFYPQAISHAVRKTHTFAANGETAMEVCRVPAGSLYLASALTTVAYDDSGSDAISVGHTGAGYTDSINAASVAALGQNLGVLVYTASEVSIFALYAGQNNNATVGTAIILVEIWPAHAA